MNDLTTYLVSAIVTLSGVIAVLWVELKKARKRETEMHERELEMTVKFIEATNKSMNTVDRLAKAIEGNTQMIGGITASDWWKFVNAQQFIADKRKPKRNDENEL